MTKKEIEKVLKAIRKYCDKAESCEGCVFDVLCYDSPMNMGNSVIDVMVSEIKEVMRNDGN